jgi:hypothetical protein
MLKNKKAIIIALSSFLSIQSVLFVLVQTTKGEINDVVSFAVVVLSALFMLLCIQRSKSYILMQIGLICTVFADLFLVVIDPMIQLPAMVFFSGTQICYFLRIYFTTTSKKEKLIHLILRASLIVIIQIITVIVLKEKTDALSLVSMFYYTNLVLNVIFAFVHFKKLPLFAIGLILFLLCDTIIGLDIMAESYITGKALETFNSILTGLNWAWVFYVPSQALLGISLLKLKE